MAVAQHTEEDYGLRLFIRDIARRRGKGFLPKALGFSVVFHVMCLLFYLVVYHSEQELDVLRIKRGDPRYASREVPQQEQRSVAVGIVKAAPKPPAPETPKEAPRPLASHWSFEKLEPPKPVPLVTAPAPVPRPLPEPQPAPKLVVQQAAPSAPAPTPPALAAAANALEPVPGENVAGYEHGTDELVEQEQPESYVDKLAAYVHTFFVYPDIAREERLSGSVTLEVKLARDGTILHYEIVKSTGYAILDMAAEQMAQNANPAPPIPPDEPRDTYYLNYNLAVTLQEKPAAPPLPSLLPRLW